jgi:hypothetical protein
VLTNIRRDPCSPKHYRLMNKNHGAAQVCINLPTSDRPIA